MRRLASIVGSVLMVCCVMCQTAFPATEDASPQTPPKAGISSAPPGAQPGADPGSADSQKPRPIVYTPPLRGAPGDRIGGGTRGAGDDGPDIAVLAPDHVGLTTRAEPVLYWYLSKPTTKRIEFTLNDEQNGRTIVRSELPSPPKGGLQQIPLSQYHASLAVDRDYRWFVSVEIDPQQPAKDLSAGGSIRRIAPPATLTEKTAKAAKMDVPALCAAEGLWYDTVEALSDLMGRNPANDGLRKEWSNLMEQAGLTGVAPMDAPKSTKK